MGFWSLARVFRCHQAMANPPAIAEAAETIPNPRILETPLGAAFIPS